MKQLQAGAYLLSICLLACCFEACYVNSTAGAGELLSDGYISWTQNGVPFIVHDSLTAGDPGENLLYGNYTDSTLSLEANIVAFSGKTIQINIAHCSDTGSYGFSTWNGVSEWPGDKEQSYASVSIAEKQGMYGSDSLLNGMFRLNRLDIVHGRIAGTFAFTARRLNGTDTIRIDNGMVFEFPITVIKH